MRLNRKTLQILVARQAIKTADLAGLSQSTVTSIINGKTCTILSAGKLAKALGVDIEEIIEEDYASEIQYKRLRGSFKPCRGIYQAIGGIRCKTMFHY